MKKVIAAAAISISLFIIGCGKPVEEAPPVKDRIGYSLSDIPAEDFRLQPGDEILEIDGTKVNENGGDFESLVERTVYSNGDSVELQLDNGDSIEIAIQCPPIDTLVGVAREVIESQDSEQGGADQPAPESKPEGAQSPKPESDVRCQ